jgi:hypothetical protein
VKRRDWLFWLLALIAAATAATGLVQLIAPQFILHLTGGSTDAAGQHFFRLVGMFMILFGGLMLQSLFSPRDEPIAVFWCMCQKFGAAAGVAVGIRSGFFGPIAWIVAGFDFVTALLMLVYWRRR